MAKREFAYVRRGSGELTTKQKEARIRNNERAMTREIGQHVDVWMAAHGISRAVSNVHVVEAIGCDAATCTCFHRKAQDGQHTSLFLSIVQSIVCRARRAGTITTRNDRAEWLREWKEEMAALRERQEERVNKPRAATIARQAAGMAGLAETNRDTPVRESPSRN